jgi:hypothetical protein
MDNYRLLGFFSLLGVPIAMLFKRVAVKRTIHPSLEP